MNNREIGAALEAYATKHLIKMGFTILERNFRYGRAAEIDIIAYKNSVLHIVEVKARSSSKYGLPSEAIDYKKISNIRKATEYYIHTTKSYDRDICFDVVEIYFSRDKNDDNFVVSHINMIQNAF